MHYDISICIQVCVSIYPYTQKIIPLLLKTLFNWLLLAHTVSPNIDKALDEAGPTCSPSPPATTPSALSQTHALSCLKSFAHVSMTGALFLFILTQITSMYFPDFGFNITLSGENFWTPTSSPLPPSINELPALFLHSTYQFHYTFS